jgi:gas vesicle protein
MSELETRTRTSYLGVLAGFIGGALVGTVATLLLAPRSGSETRRRIVEGAEHSRETLERMAAAAKEGATAARAAFATTMHEEAPRH